MRRLQQLTISLLLICCITFASGCATKDRTPIILYECDVPIDVYDKDGKLVKGYRGYCDSFINELLHELNARLDEEGVPDPARH